MSSRNYSPADRVLMRLHRLLASAGADAAAAPPDARAHSAGLMRVNHAGEVAAQALYQGQALTARDPAVRAHLLEAAREEQAHLRWCRERLTELGEQPSRLDPLWHAGSYAIGAVAGLAGDRWSLGFVEETEKQVVEHLESHLAQLPAEDSASRSIVERMRADEARHSRKAAEAGARELPAPVRALMRGVARIMTRSAYWV